MKESISIPRSLKITGLVAGSIGLLTMILATLTYAAVKPGFNLLETYLSDMGATPIWPQVFWNSGMLIVSPLRYVVLVLLILRLYQLGAGRIFGAVALIFGFFSTLGTIIMSAVPLPVPARLESVPEVLVSQ